MLRAIASRLTTSFGRLDVFLALACSFVGLGLYLDDAHQTLSGKDRFTGKGRDMIQGRYMGINHEGPWDADEFTVWFGHFSDAEKANIWI
jgi:hypothetical protein